ncbi:hypothetical protein JB92DRAFT_3118038 [Gautieria morchelliformis]|nr:hypothetical protein JB92DRAFT_3118038 [Gautieria morchelliformis]
MPIPPPITCAAMLTPSLECQLLDPMLDGGGYLPADVVPSLASHSVTHSHHIDPTIEKAPFDSMPFDIESDFLIAHVSRTPCSWQGFINIDCSDVIPIPVPASGKPAM